MVRHKHYTFRRGQQVIEHGIRYLTEICEALQSLQTRDHDERLKMLLDSVTANQRDLLASIEQFRKDASDKVLDTYTQYTVEMPTDIEPPDDPPLTTLRLIQWLEELNGHLQELFHGLAENRDADEATEAFAALARQIEAHDMRLSKEYQRTEDL